MHFFQKTLTRLFLLSIILFGASFFFMKDLPDRGEILPELQNDPVQTDTGREPFEFDYRDKTYRVVPRAEYELWGLVVTHNNINAWYNVYHDKDSVNIKDLCVIWGDNTASGLYGRMKFKSGEWTCYPRYKHGVARAEAVQYRADQLSNNHLFTDDPDLQDLVRRTKVGDQIHLKGLLAEYGPIGMDERYYRGTSLTRNDTGNGACETIFVEDFEITKPINNPWHLIHEITKKAILPILFLKFILLIIESHRSTRRLNDY